MRFRSESEAPVLIWVCDDADWRMVEALVEVENSDAGEVPDLFVDLRTVFATPEQYGRHLLRDFATAFDESRDDLDAEDIEASWSPPDAGPVTDEKDAAVDLLRTCASFRAFYDDLIEELVLVLLPEQIADPPGWRHWVHHLAYSAVSEGIRFLILDPARAPLLEGFGTDPEGPVVREHVDLEMATAFEELTEGGDPGLPGVPFRRQFVALANAVRAGDLEGARESARVCLAIATEHGWWDQAVVTTMSLAGMLLSQAMPGEAIDVYRKAQRYAGQVEPQADGAATGKALGPSLLAQARMGEASVHLSEERPLDAAHLYRETALLDGLDDDTFLRLENWRMAAACFEASGDVAQAWTCGWRALDAGAELDPHERASSTLSFVGAGLLNLCRSPEHESHRDLVDERMTELLGDGWEPEGDGAS